MTATLKTTLRAGCALLALSASLLPGAARAADASIFSAVAAPRGAALTALPASAPMHVVLALPLRDPEGAQRFADAVSDPQSPLRGHYLTPAEFGARFGADAATYEYVRNWAASLGFEISPRTDSRTTIGLSGTAAQFAALFQTRFATFHNPANGDGQVTLTPPRLPDMLAGRVSGVIGLAFAQHDAPLFKLPAGPRADVGTGKGGGYAPADIKAAYDIPSQTSSTKTEIAAIFEQGGYSASDLTTYEKQYALPAVPVTVVAVNKSPTGPKFGVLLEAQLDLDVLVGLDPQLKGIRLYCDSKDSFQTALLDSLTQMAQDDLATVISISYGQNESTQGASAIQAENTALIQLKAQGQTVFASSGDSGANNFNVQDPGAQQNLSGVGGTTLNTVAGTQKWSSETTWTSGGGGISNTWSIPSYQLVNGVSIATANGGSATMRNDPDVAADANPNTGYSVYCPGLNCEGLGWGAVGGTSLSSPIWAAMISIVNADRVAKHEARIGYFNSVVYPLAPTGTGFHDIVSGNNGSPGFTAGPGYDNVTGVGSIDLGLFLPTVL